MNVDLFEKYKLASELTSVAVSRKTERGELQKELMENLNTGRVGKFKPLTLPRMGKLLEGKTLSQIYEIRSRCKQEADRNKSKYFETYSRNFWSILKKQK